MFEKVLNDGYLIREVSLEEYRSLVGPHFKRVFANRVQDSLPLEIDEDSKKKISERNNVQRFELRLAVFKGDELVGWHFGCEQSSEVYYMQNSAILEDYRNKKLYAQLLDTVLERVQVEGFQVVTSAHHPNNAAVLIPKLKRGFCISGMQYNEQFRFLVELKYFYNLERRKNYFKNLGLEL